MVTAEFSMLSILSSRAYDAENAPNGTLISASAGRHVEGSHTVEAYGNYPIEEASIFKHAIKPMATFHPAAGAPTINLY